MSPPVLVVRPTARSAPKPLEKKEAGEKSSVAIRMKKTTTSSNQQDEVANMMKYEYAFQHSPMPAARRERLKSGHHDCQTYAGS